MLTLGWSSVAGSCSESWPQLRIIFNPPTGHDPGSFGLSGDPCQDMLPPHSFEAAGAKYCIGMPGSSCLHLDWPGREMWKTPDMSVGMLAED